ncbi:LOW QUALITY PROTEIN: hypothetical protein PHMEG_00016496 [Phytophthora megakarya]|uniref:Uncharacterized protein n=1 Tax=Phytophthora megakarya TaxID=4795 RepID=A0A225VYV9_9STRA|nr:LOW QUALITY PROTEIN: hypothetical protein PHMEG_00016496 [Phytophthora megakarya]
MLNRVAEPAGATATLTSHSFRRGGAQHANGDDRLAAQWIFDRGAWGMTKTNKAFAYITDTTREDRKVARVLSGWATDELPVVLDIAKLDHARETRTIASPPLQLMYCLKQHTLNVSTKVLSVLTAYLIRYYPQLKELAPTSPIVTRVEECLSAAHIMRADMLAWAVALNNEPLRLLKREMNFKTRKVTSPSTDHLVAVIHELIETNRTLALCLTILEARLLTPKKRLANTEAEQVGVTSRTKTQVQEEASHQPSTTWYEWYISVPRAWASSDHQKKSESRHVVVFMKLFLVDGFTLDINADDYKDQVLGVGRQAEAAVLAFLKTRKSNAKGAGSVLRALRPLHKSGALDEYIVGYKRLLAIDRIQDPAPVETQDILATVGHV